MKNFNDSIRITSMGQILTADTLINDTIMAHLPGVLASVNSITPASNIETNMQTVARIYLRSVISQNDTLTGTQLNTLRILANKCPFLDGTAVYEARAMLVAYDGIKLYDDSCSNDRDDEHRMIHGDDNENNAPKEVSVSIYPNPNNGSFTLSYQLQEGQTGKVILFNTTGQQLGEYLLNASTGKMTIILC